MEDPNSESVLRRRVREHVEADGQYATATMLGLHPQTVLAIAAGVPVTRGTFALVRERLGESAKPPRSASARRRRSA